MKVNLATQVLSNTVPTHLEEKYGESVSETVLLLQTMNNFFDCLNTKNLYEGGNKRNLDFDPYTNVQQMMWFGLLIDTDPLRCMSGE